MSQSDSEQINNLLGRESGHSKYEVQESQYLTDLNLGSYNQPIRFNTQRWMDELMKYPNAYVKLYLVAEGVANTNTLVAADVITVFAAAQPSPEHSINVIDYEKLYVCLKNGAYSIVNGLNLKLNGKTIQNSSDVHFANHIHALTEWSKDYAESTGVMHQFAKDTLDENLTVNKGFETRGQLHVHNTTIVQVGALAANTPCTIRVEFEVELSLSILSDFFAQLGVPLKNANFDMLLSLNGIQGMSGNGANFDMLAIHRDLATALNATVAGRKMTLRVDTSKPARLYCNRVELSPADELELAAQVAKTDADGNPTKEIKVVWNDSQTVLNTTPDTFTTLNMSIAPAIRRPLRVWSFFVPKVASNGASKALDQSLAYPMITAHGIKHPNETKFTVNRDVGITNANLRVDSKKLYQENINTPFEFYEFFRDQTLAGSDNKQIGSLVSYKDFTEWYQYYCFDMTKTAYKITDKPVALEFMADKVHPLVPTNLYHVIELETVTILKIGNGNVLITQVGVQ